MKKITLSILLLFASYSFAFADTEVSGLITEDTTWTVENSPYILTSRVGVDYQVTLTIEPGVQVKSNAGGLEIMGKILAHGNSSNPIIFTTLDENPSWYGWRGIVFDHDREAQESWEGSVLEWCEFSWMFFGVTCPTSTMRENPILSITNCTFSNIGYSGIRFQINSIIQNNYFTKCGSCIVSGNGGTIEDNICENNYGYGISASSEIISGNIIINNQEYGISSSNSLIFDNIIFNNVEEGIISHDSTITHNLISGNSILEFWGMVILFITIIF